jgi:hypothetical protein
VTLTAVPAIAADCILGWFGAVVVGAHGSLGVGQ